ncbi:MAG TPA: GNAT family N-acetyltransferase [Pyrinomonadaceae bacterium]
MKDYVIRRATLADRPDIERLIECSARGLSQHDYSKDEIEAAIAGVFGVDTDLIRDGTYFVAEAAGLLVGCGGWSKRRNLFGGDRYHNREGGELDPTTEPAKIRAFFVHPDWARKGIAKTILSLCEGEAEAFGFRSVELMATLPGVRLYVACGYERGETVMHVMENGIKLPLMPMRKPLG